MLTTGPNLGLIDNGEFGERVYRETLQMYRGLDVLVQPRVASMSVSIPPTLPNEGSAYIVPTGATGEWSSKAGLIARWTERSGAVEHKWEYFTPKNGWEFSVDDIGSKVKFDGNAWVGSGFVVSSVAPDNNDGRPDGTMYIQII